MASEGKQALVVFFLTLFSTVTSFAQLSLPPFDVELKGSVSVFPGQGNVSSSGTIERIQTFNIHGAAHWQLNQNIGIGWFYCRSVNGGVYTHGDNGTKSKTSDAQMLATGPQVRLSTGRGKTWRPYMTVNYCQLELINDLEGYRLANKSKAVGGSIGIMLRLSNKVYLNLLEVSYRKILTEAFWFPSNSQMIEAKTGVTVNFGKRK